MVKEFISILALPVVLALVVSGALGCGKGEEGPTRTATPAVAPAFTLAPPLTPTSTPAASFGQEAAQVLRIIDGDTIVLLSGERVRYIGIDTPEIGQCYYQEATDKNIQLVEGKTVSLEKDVSKTDIYGRLLRYVYVDDLFVNAELVSLGYAEAHPYPSDTKYSQFFSELEQEARAEARGMWGVCATPTPTPMPTETPIPSPTPTPPIGAGNVQIVYIFYDGLVPYVESDEYVEVKNLGGEAQDLAGWVLRDISEGYPSFTFPHYILEPGATIRVYTNEIHPDWGGFNFGYGKAAWNNTDPDTAALYDDEGREVSRRSY